MFLPRNDAVRFKPHSDNLKNGIYLLNDYLVGPLNLTLEASHSASQAFVDAIYDEIHDGYSFVPLIGAGFSVSAGIPIVEQLKEYLRRCICVALGVETAFQSASVPGNYERPQLWNPRIDKWPPLLHRAGTDGRKSKDWLQLIEARYHSEKERWDRVSSGDPSIFLEAMGAMAEWRTALYFLSRLTLDHPRRGRSADCESVKEPKPSLGEPCQEVIDACFREVMRGKRPSLNHSMLAALSGLLRIDTILTTNFDNLVEQAFDESRNPLEVFDVHLNEALPDSTAVCRVLSR